MSASTTAPPAPSPATGAGVLAVVSALAWVLVMVASPVAANPTEGRWQWPMDPPHHILHRFEEPEHRYAAGHRGLDIGAPSGVGTAVRAVETGTVRFAGEVAGRGVVSVLHADGLLSTYEPVTAGVAAGEHVTAGAVLGQVTEARVGDPHCPEGPCLHLGARRGEDYLDPLLLLGARGPSVLLPLGGGTGEGTDAGGGHSPAGTGARTPLGTGTRTSEPEGGGSAPSSDVRSRSPLHSSRWVLIP